MRNSKCSEDQIIGVLKRAEKNVEVKDILNSLICSASLCADSISTLPLFENNCRPFFGE